jgi:hypothetical protein
MELILHDCSTSFHPLRLEYRSAVGFLQGNSFSRHVGRQEGSDYPHMERQWFSVLPQSVRTLAKNARACPERSRRDGATSVAAVQAEKIKGWASQPELC